MDRYHSSRFMAYASRFTLFRHTFFSRLEYDALAILLLSALALRLYRFTAAFWYDEVFSASLANLPLRRLLAATVGDVHPPAYYLLLWALKNALGVSSEFVLRLPSLLAGLALIWAVYRLGRALALSEKAVWVATGITALAPFQVYYSQEARSYALLMLAVTLAAVGLVERRAWLLVLCSLAALYLHHLAAPFVGMLLLLAVTTRRWPWLTLAKIVVAVAVGFAPGALLTFYQMGQITGNYWVPPLSSPGRIIGTFDDLIFFSPNNTFVLASGLVTALGLVLLLADWRHWVEKPFLLLTIGLPTAFIAAVSLWWQPVFISRIMAPVTPFYYLALADTVTRTQRRWLAWSIPALATIAIISVVGPQIGDVGRQPGKEIFSQIATRPGDAVYHANVGSYLIWAYYRPDVPHYLLPNKNGLDQSLSDETKEAMGLTQADFDTIACSHPRWWLIYFHNPTTDQGEINAIAHIEQDYPSERVIKLRSDNLVESWVVRVEPDCQ